MLHFLNLRHATLQVLLYLLAEWIFRDGLLGNPIARCQQPQRFLGIGLTRRQQHLLPQAMTGIPAGLPTQPLEHHGIDRLGGEIGDVGHRRETASQPFDHVVAGAEQAADRIRFVLERIERRQGGVKRAVMLIQPLFEAFESLILFFGTGCWLAHRLNQQRQ
ncbi:hypothetical protein D3C76_1007750 [compost metagenome]